MLRCKRFRKIVTILLLKVQCGSRNPVKANPTLTQSELMIAGCVGGKRKLLVSVDNMRCARLIINAPSTHFGIYTLGYLKILVDLFKDHVFNSILVAPIFC